MPDLLLRTRMTALEANVQRVRRLLKALKTRKEVLDEIAGLVRQQQLRARTINRGLDDARDSVDDENYEEGLATLVQTAGEVEQLAAQFGELSRKVAALQSSSAHMFQGENMELRAAIANEMERRPQELLASIGGVSGILATPAGSHQAWVTYRDQVHMRAQAFFAEYVDLIAGLALRNVGFDEGVCELADELMSSYTFNRGDHYDLLALPSRQRAVSMTWARIIRLGGPDWSLWALPFAGHEFWYVVARQAIGARHEVAGIDVSSPQLQECLADAFATYAMGPAYAYACVLLRLDPCSAFMEDAEHAADDTRAHAIFTMLEQMDGVRPELRPYAELTRDLRTNWQDAVDCLQPPGQPQNERKQQLAAVVQEVFKLLQSRTTGGFSVDAWVGLQEWTEKLSTGMQGAIAVSQAHELRQVINTAWLARLAHPEKVGDIASQAEQLWKRVVDKNKGGGQSRGRQADVRRPPTVE